VVEEIQAGITDYLVKPFTPDVLRDKLSKFAAIG
jgi:response regulator of citrate/malate metabolism